MEDKDPVGMSPVTTKFNESFFFLSLSNEGVFTTTEPAAIAQPFEKEAELSQIWGAEAEIREVSENSSC